MSSGRTSLLAGGAPEADWALVDSYPSLLRDLRRRYRRRGIREDDAIDLAQETMVRTFVHLKRHGQTADDLQPLIATISRNLLIERARQARKQEFVELVDGDDVEDVGPQPSDVVVANEQRAQVRAAIVKLSPRYRRVVGLWIKGLDPSEIARDLGIKRNAADVLLHRAKRSLASKLEATSGSLGLVGLVLVRLRSAIRRVANAVSTVDPTGALANATGGLAVVGAVAVLAIAGVHGTGSVGNADDVSATRAIAAVGLRSADGRPASAVRHVKSATARDQSRDIAGVGTEVTNPATGRPDDLGFDIWYEPESNDVVVPAVESAAERGCDMVAAGCNRAP